MDKFLLLLFLFSLTVIPSNGQLNIKVGYSGSYGEANEINGVINRFNDERPFLEQKLNEMHLLSGLEIGFRYRLGISAFEISWGNVSAESEAFGTDNGVPFEERLTTSLRSYSVTFDNFLGDFGFGASLATRKLKMKTDIAGFNRDRQILSDSGLISRFHIFYQLVSNNVSLTIKPFVEYPWEKLNVYGLEREYFPDSTLPAQDFDADLTVFGVSFLFYNGPQR